MLAFLPSLLGSRCKCPKQSLVLFPAHLQMDDGKCTRCTDLYALFEQILEKTMRQEQRVWAESPVKVWVNTFKVFLDEFMTEYKPLDSAASKVGRHAEGRSDKSACSGLWQELILVSYSRWPSLTGRRGGRRMPIL